MGRLLEHEADGSSDVLRFERPFHPKRFPRVDVEVILEFGVDEPRFDAADSNASVVVSALEDVPNALKW